MSTRARLTALFAVIGALIAVAVVLTIAVRPAATNAAAAGGASTYQVAAGMDDCGSGWGAKAGGSGSSSGTAVPGGEMSFDVANGTIAGIEVYVQAVDTKKVYLDLESIGAGAHATARVTLGSGRYRFVCLPADAEPVQGPVVAVGTAPPGSALTPGIVPVTRTDLIPVAKAYTAWVAGRLPALRKQVAAVAADAEEGDLPAAKRDWITAHSTYETLGGAYGAFGDAGDALDGLPRDGLTGFHLVESKLWSGAPAPVVASAAHSLVGEVERLAPVLDRAQLDPGDVALRAHEIVEDAIRDVLTGQADAGSGTELATVDANLIGAAGALAPLRSILSSRYPSLGATERALASAQHLVETFRAADGSWTPLARLSRADRERVDAALGDAAELLAPVAAICDPRREP